MNCTKHFDLSSSLTASYIARFMICWVCRLYFSGLVCSVLSQESGGLQTMQSHSPSGTVLCVTRRALGFSVLRYWLFFRSVYRFLCQNTSVSRFGVHCGLQIFRLLAFGFRFSRKILTGFRIWYPMWFRFFLLDIFGFRFLFDLSGNYAPPLISNIIAAKRKCYRDECVTNQLKYRGNPQVAYV